MIEDAGGVPGAAAGLRAWRERQGWTLDEVAGVTGLSKSFLSRIEGGAREAAPATKVLMARRLGTSVTELFPAAPPEGEAADGRNPGPVLHTYQVQRHQMRAGFPLTFSGGERIVAVLSSSPVPGYERAGDIEVTVLVELP